MNSEEKQFYDHIDQMHKKAIENYPLERIESDLRFYVFLKDKLQKEYNVRGDEFSNLKLQSCFSVLHHLVSLKQYLTTDDQSSQQALDKASSFD